MKKSDLDRSMAQRSPLGKTAPVTPVNLYEAQAAKPKNGSKEAVSSATSEDLSPGKLDIQDYAQQYRRQDDDKRTVSVKMRPGRHEQIRHEAQSTGMYEWQVVDVALELYFRAKREGK